MSKFILKNGSIAAAIMIIASLLSMLFFNFKNTSYTVLEVIGYIIIFLALSFIFIGMRQYKIEYEQAEKTMSFGKGLKVGVLIALFPSIAFFIYTAIFIAVAGEEFMQFSLDQYKSSMDAAEYEAMMEQFNANAGLYMNPFFQGLIMFLTVFVLGFIVALISSWILSRRRVAAS